MTRTSKRSFGDSRPADWTPEWCPPPMHGTRRRPERKSLGPAVAKVAQQLGTPFFPAQRLVMDTAMELDPDTGLLAYGTVSALVHRQFGKTMCLLLPQMVMRGMLYPDQRMVYTAQDRNHARAKFEEDYVGRIRRSTAIREGRDYTVRLANGSERISFPRTRSLIFISATQGTSGHSKTLDVAAVDEAWAHQDTTVDSGFRVPMITRKMILPGAQQWIVSAAGEEWRSFYLEDKVERGRRAAVADKGSGLCHFDWQCPDDWDIENPELWWYFIPALGHTITEADIAEELQVMDEADWRRAYGSQPKKGEAKADAALSVEAWAKQALTGPEMAAHPMVGRLVVGVGMPPTRSHTALGVAGFRADGAIHVDFIEGRAGTGWVVERIRELFDRWQDLAAVAIDSGGPAKSLIPELEAAGIQLVKMSGSDYAAACGDFHDRVVEQPARLWHGGQAALDDSVEGAVWRPLGDQRAWDRRSPDADVAPLEAVTLAAGGLLKLPAEEPPAATVYANRGFFDVFGGR